MNRVWKWSMSIRQQGHICPLFELIERGYCIWMILATLNSRMIMCLTRIDAVSFRRKRVWHQLRRPLMWRIWWSIKKFLRRFCESNIFKNISAQKYQAVKLSLLLTEITRSINCRYLVPFTQQWESLGSWILWLLFDDSAGGRRAALGPSGGLSAANDRAAVKSAALLRLKTVLCGETRRLRALTYPAWLRPFECSPTATGY